MRGPCAHAPRAKTGCVARDFADDLAAVARVASVPLILDVFCRVTGMRYAAITRVTSERWVCLASKDLLEFGIGPGGELPIETTICHEVHGACAPVVIDHVAEDSAYRDHHTPAMYGFQSYISVPITLADGSFFGTLCAIDPAPRKLKELGAVELFRLFAELISTHLQNVHRAESAEASLLDERTTADLREKFIAVLGHDLRNPLAAIAAGNEVLSNLVTDERALRVFAKTRNSVVRMTKLIDDVTDFARGSLGGGMSVERSTDALEPTIRHVVEELRSAHPGRVIDLEVNVTKPVQADRHRIAQLLSNLLGNALRYGAEDAPINVRASTDDAFELTVVNRGPEIPQKTLPRLFAPFTRGTDRPDDKGLGLGLYIASEIARAHGGTIDVESANEVTRFTFRMPIAG